MIFTNEDLKPGMLVELKNGVTGILIPVDDELEVFNEYLTAKTSAYLFTNSILDTIDQDYGIIKIYGLSKNYDLFNKHAREVLWEYKEPVREMTIKEIETLLGFPIRIVKSEEK